MPYLCASCDGEITVRDNLNNGLISINVNGHAKPAHRVCPDPATDPEATKE